MKKNFLEAKIHLLCFSWGMFSRLRLFQKAATAIFAIFMGMMVLVTIVAYARPSGTTRQDMALAPMIRANAIADKNSAVEKQTATNCDHP
jgi:hypothetical protein